MELSATPLARLDAAGLARLTTGATVIRTAPAVFRVEGPGAVACLQGLVTNDIEKPGPNSLTYNALLTPKGMIVLDLWSLRDVAGFTLVTDAAARDDALALFRRTLPPRLAKLTDHTGEWEALWLIGAAVPEHWARASLGSFPAPGKVGEVESGDSRCTVAAGTPAAWFRGLVTGPAPHLRLLAGNLHAAGMVEGGDADITAARVMAGWPALGAEIAEKTLPQEVRYDEIGGVSYTKGCYLGQETVARVHFRGHPNRELRGLLWEGDLTLTGSVVTMDGREVGTVRSVLELPNRVLALATIRREVETGARVIAGEREATVVALPFGTGTFAA